MNTEGHFCWEDCDEGPHGCICGNNCEPPTSHRGEAGDGPTTTNPHAAYAAYRAGEISRAAWSGIMLAEFNTEPTEQESES